jgi:hypothetical protein
MALQHRPRATYGLAGSETTFEPALPQRPWTPMVEDVEGHNEAAMGAREAFTIRQADLLEVRLRVLESEIPALFAFLRWGVREWFTWWNDRDEAASFQAILESPRPGERYRPQRDREDHSVFEITLVMRVEGADAAAGY